MPKQFHERSVTTLILAVLLVVAVGLQLSAALASGHDSWPLTECLINYSGGFVRRGLPGEIIFQLSHVTGIAGSHLAIAGGFTAYLVLMLWFLRHARGDFPTALLLSCIAMGFPAYQGSIVRKDCLGLLWLAGCLAADRSLTPRPVAIFFMNLCACAAILSHEAFAFYAVPAILFFCRGHEVALNLKISIGRLMMLLPAFGCIMLTILYHGSPVIADAINDSWLPLWKTTNPGDPSITEPSAAIAGIGWSGSEGVAVVLGMLETGIYQPAAWTMVYAATFFLMLSFSHRKMADDKRWLAFATILIAQFCFISPLFLLGIDYGRWLFLWTSSSIMIHCASPGPPMWLVRRIGSFFDRVRLRHILSHTPARNWHLLLFGAPICWNAREFLTASPLGRCVHYMMSSLS